MPRRSLAATFFAGPGPLRDRPLLPPLLSESVPGGQKRWSKAVRAGSKFYVGHPGNLSELDDWDRLEQITC